ncbi:hypothetical protein FJ366_02485 [Candidatus Dependentiae bacterium]|nr:hypothetical protein [Candidatus Dependentiae bacterium]
MFNLKNIALLSLLLGLVAPVSALYGKSSDQKTEKTQQSKKGRCSVKKGRKQLTDAEKAERKAKRAEKRKNMTPEQKAEKKARRNGKNAKKAAQPAPSNVTMFTDIL